MMGTNAVLRACHTTDEPTHGSSPTPDTQGNQPPLPISPPQPHGQFPNSSGVLQGAGWEGRRTSLTFQRDVKENSFQNKEADSYDRGKTHEQAHGTPVPLQNSEAVTASVNTEAGSLIHTGLFLKRKRTRKKIAKMLERMGVLAREPQDSGAAS